MSKNIRLLSLFVFALGLFLLIPSRPAHAAYNASDVLGQLNGDGNPVFTTNASGTSPTALYRPQGSTVDTVHHRLFVADSSNNRVLVYNLDSNNNLLDHTADYVLGQPNFTSSTVTTTQSSMFGPREVAYNSASNTLYVVDGFNNRVLVFDVSTITNGQTSTCVLGQSDFTSIVATTTQTGMDNPSSIAIDPDHDRLFVGEWNNSRVLVYTLSTACQTKSASYVLGQTNFTNKVATSTQTGMDSVTGVAYASNNNRLYVSDGNNNRVLVFDVSTVTNGKAASYVLGQGNFTSKSEATTQGGFVFPYGVMIDTSNNWLYVADGYNYRVLVFDASSLSNGKSAINVIGQSDFTSTATGDTQSLMAMPMRGYFDVSNRRAYIGDYSNHRIMIFNFVNITSTTLATAYTNIAYSDAVTSTNYQGTLEYGVTSGALPTGLSLSTSTGAITGTPTETGVYTFTITATDTLSTGPFTDHKDFTITVENALPTLTSISPSSAMINDTYTPITLTLTGTGFVPSSTVTFNGHTEDTTYVSATEITAVIPVSDLGVYDASLTVSVTSPEPGGGTSNSAVFTTSIRSGSGPVSGGSTGGGGASTPVTPVVATSTTLSTTPVSLTEATTKATAAGCPTLSAGDMIKVSGKPAIYTINNNLQVLYFPSGDEFKSWNSDDTYGNYTTITQACYDSLSVPSTFPVAVNFRPGSYIVKRPSSDQLYVVLPNNTLAKINTTDAAALYGQNYTAKTISDIFWPNYINRGADISNTAHQGLLISKDNKTYYTDSNNTLREVTNTGMTENRFKPAFIHTVSDSYLTSFTTGSLIDSLVPTISNRT